MPGSGPGIAVLKGLALVVALIGCALAQAAQAGFDGQRIKIGILTDFASLHAINTGQGSLVAAQLAVEDFGGTVSGLPIEIVAADHRNQPELGAEIARRWYASEGVNVIIDVPNTDVALAVQRVARDQNRIVIFSAPAASDLTGAACTPVSLHWTYDTYALAQLIATALLEAGFKSWYFITADYTFGHTLEREAASVVTANGGSVVGSVRFRTNNSDFSPFLLQAQQSNAQVLALSSAGGDTPAAIRQAYEFGMLQSQQRLVALLVAEEDVHSLGLGIAQGLPVVSAFYWDLDDRTRAFSQRFFARRQVMPNMYQAGVAGAVTHYLKAVQAAGTDRTDAVMAKMRDLPVNDFMTRNGRVREDGRVSRDMYLFQVKAPADSKSPWDYYRLVRVVPGERAFRPLAASECPLVKR